MSNVWKFKIDIKDENVFNKVAKKYNINFPDDLKEFILQYNAASPDDNCVVIEGVERIYDETLSYNEDEVEASTFESAKKSIDNSDFLPFAKDPFGNYFCYSIASGKISFYDQDEEVFSNSNYSLDEFIGALYS